MTTIAKKFFIDSDDILEDVNLAVKNDSKITVSDMNSFSCMIKLAKGVQFNHATETVYLLMLGSDPIKIGTGYVAREMKKFYGALKECMVKRLNNKDIYETAGWDRVFFSGDLKPGRDSDIVMALRSCELL